jgi:glycosyltransferase involved in cell wall biosynthesis
VKRLSVVIANYNYAHFVSYAIESALALQWPDVEVVVVDDGSTDDSADVIRRYADRATVCLADNGGQRVAANRGFALSTGDVVIFLDADDVLPPELPARLAAVWTPRLSKVQFQMQRIDRTGTPFGPPFPSYEPVPTAGDIRRWMQTTSAYPTPPGSGNAYARWFLEEIFPLEPSIGDFADSGCLAAAPLLGEVVCLPGVLVGYRQHGDNDSNLLVDHRRFPREVARARARWRFAQRAAGAPDATIDEQPLRRSRELLQHRVVSRRVAPAESPLPGDSSGRLLLDTLRSPFHPGPEGPAVRLAVALWCLAVLAAPSGLTGRLLALRYSGRP